ncbi:MAG: PKD domain-containing protein [Bacteroidetes bacterium]|nr:PKD domain-containing protein [Bacteroidota bacterium]
MLEKQMVQLFKLQNGGIAPYLYTWSNGIVLVDNINISAGNYVLTVTDSIGCAQLFNYSVLQNSSLVAGFTMSSDTVYLDNNEVVVFTNTSNSGLDYTWDFGDGSAVSYEENPNYLYKIDGIYQVMLIVTDGVCSDTLVQTVYVLPSSVPTGIVDSNEQDSYVIANIGEGAFELIFNYNSIAKVKSKY